MRKFATRFLQTPIGELRATKFPPIASHLWDDRAVQTKVGYSDEGNSRGTGISPSLVGGAVRGWLA